MRVGPPDIAVIEQFLVVFFCRIISHTVFQSTVHPGMIILVGVNIGLFIRTHLYFGRMGAPKEQLVIIQIQIIGVGIIAKENIPRNNSGD